MSDGLPEKIKQAILDIFEDNNNPLSFNELIFLIDRKIGNGEINDQLTEAVIKEMRDGFKIKIHSDGKISRR